MKKNNISFDDAIANIQRDLLDFNSDCEIQHDSRTQLEWDMIFTAWRRANRKKKALKPLWPI